MAHREIKQEEVSRLVDDASYLQDEAEALRYVIDSVPYDESPPGGKSIADMLLMIDYAQLSYYRPILEQAIESARPIHLKDYTHFKESFEADQEKKSDIQKILRKLAKHRAGVVNAIKNTSLIDWETMLNRDNGNILLFDFMQEMIRFERDMLKKIAERVMVYSQDKETQRQIDKRRSKHEGKQITENN